MYLALGKELEADIKSYKARILSFGMKGLDLFDIGSSCTGFDGNLWRAVIDFKEVNRGIWCCSSQTLVCQLEYFRYFTSSIVGKTFES